MQGPPPLEQATRPNLDKTLATLLGGVDGGGVGVGVEGDDWDVDQNDNVDVDVDFKEVTVTVTDSLLPISLEIRLRCSTIAPDATSTAGKE